MSVNKEQLFINCLETVNDQINKYQGKLDELSGFAEEHKIKPEFDEYGNKGEMLTRYEQTAAYLDNAREMKETLANLDRGYQSEVVRPGSVVETDSRYFYVSVPLGAIQMDSGSQIYAISTEAPIYRELEGKKVGDKLMLDGEEKQILAIY